MDYASNVKSLFVILFTLAPAVYGCVNFQARYVPNTSGSTIIDAQLWDNLAQSDTPTCSMYGSASGDGLYHLNCVSNDITATYSDYYENGIVEYSRPGGSFEFSVPEVDFVLLIYATCVYSCDTCFVPT